MMLYFMIFRLYRSIYIGISNISITIIIVSIIIIIAIVIIMILLRICILHILPNIPGQAHHLPRKVRSSNSNNRLSKQPNPGYNSIDG